MASPYQEPRLVSLKVVIFFIFSAIGALAPFLNLHVKELGMTAQETGVIMLVAGFFSILGPIFGGILTEKHGKFKPVFFIFVLLTAVSYTGLLFIPKTVRDPKRLPETQLACDGSKFSILMELCPNWEKCHSEDRNLTAMFEAYSCRYVCGNNVTFFSSAELCFTGANKLDYCRTFNASILDETMKVSASKLFSRPVATKKTLQPNPNEMCVYPLKDPIISLTPFLNATCSHKKPGCDFICTLREPPSDKKKSPGEEKSIFKKLPPCLRIQGDPHMTVYVYLAVRSFADMCLMTVISLIDTVSILSIADTKGSYGSSRAWAAIGLAVTAPLSGVLMDFYTRADENINYSPAFIIFDGFMLIAAVLSIALPFTNDVIKNNVKSGCTKCLKLCQTAEGLILFLLVIILGMLWGFLDIFFYWRAFDLGASKLFIGLYFMTSFIFSVPFLAFSKNIIKGFGKANLIVYAFLFYCIRYVGYSFVENKLLLFPFQAMELFTQNLLWIAVVAFAHSIAPPGLRVSTQGTINSLHFCVGRGAGGFVGANLIQLFEMKLAFRGVGIFCGVVGILYWAAHLCCFRRKYKRQNQEYSQQGIALTGTYYPSQDMNSHSVSNRHLNGHTKPQEAHLIDENDEDLH